MYKMWSLREVRVRYVTRRGVCGYVPVTGWVRQDRPYVAVLRDRATGRYLLYAVGAGNRITPAQYEDAASARAVAAQLLALPIDWGMGSKWRLMRALVERRLLDVVKMLVEPPVAVSVSV